MCLYRFNFTKTIYSVLSPPSPRLRGFGGAHKNPNQSWDFYVVGRVGIGPTTLSLKGSCSTTELPAHVRAIIPKIFFSDKVLTIHLPPDFIWL